MKPIKQHRVITEIPEEEYRKFRAKLALNGKTVKGWIRAQIKKYIES